MRYNLFLNSMCNLVKINQKSFLLYVPCQYFLAPVYILHFHAGSEWSLIHAAVDAISFQIRTETLLINFNLLLFVLGIKFFEKKK